MHTTPYVFIIESVSFENEQDDWREGEVLSQILNLSEKTSEYRYIRTKKEFEAVLNQFSDSGFRYLHISSHGDDSGISLTLDQMSTSDFADMVRPHLKGKRLFLSVCEVTNKELAKLLIPTSGCNSIAGPEGTIEFGDAALVWASFYRLMFKQNPDAMKGKEAILTLKKVARTFGVTMKYYVPSKSKGWKGFVIKPLPTAE